MEKFQMERKTNEYMKGDSKVIDFILTPCIKISTGRVNFKRKKWGMGNSSFFDGGNTFIYTFEEKTIWMDDNTTNTWHFA